MLINAVVSINPAIILLGLVPEIDRIFKAILLCNPHDSIAEAIINPPRNNKTNGCAYELEICFNSEIPNSGNNIMGNKAVIYIGTASVIHQIVISNAIPAVIHAI
tara:strand:+ start:5313 stop:5627 length:315 start_codon:yes stop_codon:yes gene_type:complete